ncbi:hypothetical protein ILYODFUR_010077 [Ilyodon furcidens]|uniref:Uncharacterized protein n=1 Tax=Ilyodon furcidens TaxID=33524 RepID=A0ABV0U446_9TELE
MDVHRRSPSKVIELELFHQEQWRHKKEDLNHLNIWDRSTSYSKHGNYICTNLYSDNEISPSQFPYIFDLQSHPEAEEMEPPEQPSRMHQAVSEWKLQNLMFRNQNVFYYHLN